MYKRFFFQKKNTFVLVAGMEYMNLLFWTEGWVDGWID